MDDNHGCLDRDLENKFQQALFAIPGVDSYKKYFQEIGLDLKDDKEIYEKLI